MPIKTLIVDDDPAHLSMLQTLLRDWGHQTETAHDGSLAVQKIKQNPFDLVLMDVRMAEVDGIEALQQIKDYNPAIPVLIITAYSSVNNAVAALKAGAYDYLTKPLDFDLLQHTMDKALDHKRLETENRGLKSRLPPDFDLSNIVGKSQAMQDLMNMVVMTAPTEATVLIIGPSGTGKELIAQAIHSNSKRSKGPMVTVNCAALTETLLESELFGHEKGAFTGADKKREGKFLLAHHGSVFLDEIGDMPLSMQAKLLRVIQQREIQRVGSDATHQVDVRVLAATNKDLAGEVSSGRFREDLYHRLNVMELRVPGLKERPEDIPLLADHFLHQHMKKNRKTLQGFTPQAMDLLLKYDWPGNVRELENVIERAVILAAGEYITPRELPMKLEGGEREESVAEASELGQKNLEDIEKEAIVATLSKTQGNKSETARVLGITRATLHKKIKKYGLEGDH